jgi:hypothetical protein
VVRAETLLMVLVLGLYLYDSALLLYSNEAILVLAGNNRWLAGFGSNRTTLGGREFYLPSPLLPTRQLLRLSWKVEGVPAGSASVAANFAANMPFSGPLAPWVWSLAAALFIGLPLALYGGLGDWFIVWAFGLVYVNVVSMVLCLWVYRQQFNLGGRAFALLAFDLVLCPPFALNIIRKLSLRVVVKEDFVTAARCLQQPPDWQLTQTELLARLDDEIHSEADGSARQTALQQRRENIESAI